MQKLIYFRSKIESHHTTERGKKIRGQSVDISGIHLYVPGDDPRDILWKKWVGTGNIYRREREHASHPEVFLISLIDETCGDFSTESHTKTKNIFIRELEVLLTESARKLWFSYQKSSWKPYSKEWKSNAILLILWDIDSIELSRKYFPFSRNNDIIFLFLLHPVEISPREKGALIFESWKVSQTYDEVLRASIHHWKYELSSHGIAFLPCSTLDDPALLLNHFFKYRYV